MGVLYSGYLVLFHFANLSGFIVKTKRDLVYFTKTSSILVVSTKWPGRMTVVSQNNAYEPSKPLQL